MNRRRTAVRTRSGHLSGSPAPGSKALVSSLPSVGLVPNAERDVYELRSECENRNPGRQLSGSSTFFRRLRCRWRSWRCETVAYLKQVGPVGTTIGILFGAAEIASAAGALFAGRAMRLSDAQRTTLSGSALMIPELSLRPPRSLVTALRCPEHVPSPSRTLRKSAEKSNFSRSMPVFLALLRRRVDLTSHALIS